MHILIFVSVEYQVWDRYEMSAPLQISPNQHLNIHTQEQSE
jgi:hypothetical protein